MIWSVIGSFLPVMLTLHAGLLLGRPGARGVTALGYATGALATLAIVCGAAAWHREAIVREGELQARSEKDRAFVRLLHAIDAARDVACNMQPPNSTDEKLLAEYGRIRTTCAFYAMMWMEAARATDLPALLSAAQEPWPSQGSPPKQLWSYGPLTKLASEIEAQLHRDDEVPSGALADVLPFVLGGALAFAVSTATANLLASRAPRGR